MCSNFVVDKMMSKKLLVKLSKKSLFKSAVAGEVDGGVDRVVTKEREK